MKPFIWITALIVACLFLTGTAFIAFDILQHPDILTNPESKIAVGWLFTGLMFLGLGMRGWRARQKPVRGPERPKRTNSSP